MMITLTIKPKNVVKKLLAVLPERAREVLVSRYGLDKDGVVRTLEAIGSDYGITRERVRQIENYGLTSIRKSEAFKEAQDAFLELKSVIQQMGCIVEEDELLDSLSKDSDTRNYIHFLLVLGDTFVHGKEDNDFRRRWNVDEEVALKVHETLKKIYTSLSDEDLIPESDLIQKFLSEVSELNEEYRNEEIVRRWLSLSKRLGRNPLGEWGSATSPNVRAKGMRDYAFLVIKRHGSPMHFTEVAETISDLFKKRAHVATCHNELIKDKRFVLVGRGLYALSEWGYSKGVVKDVIAGILKKNGPLTREKIIDLVKKERYVKDNTILVNLQDPTFFKRNQSGEYSLVA
ncbi:MAG TPA: sigma factor-like helix-turn-helix DNA-binding protein [Candidatus Paceibacterota bacterium]